MSAIGIGSKGMGTRGLRQKILLSAATVLSALPESARSTQRAFALGQNTTAGIANSGRYGDTATQGRIAWPR